jgi:uncharacterized protein (TIGR02145 family)
MSSNLISQVKIENQIWQSVNLNVLRFNNGDSIPIIKTEKEWEKAGDNKMPACCFFNNNEKLGNTEGVLYNWYAIMDSRGLAPEGFRLPSLQDWINMLEKIGGNKKTINQGHRDSYLCEGVASKLKSNFGWEEDSLGNGTDDFGFTVQPFGGRNSSGSFDSYVGGMTSFWTTEEVDGGGDIKSKEFAFYSFFDSDENDVLFDRGLKGSGKHVRLIKV